MEIKVQAIEGYAYGAIQPSVLFYFKDIGNIQALLSHALENFLSGLPASEDVSLFEGNNFVEDSETAPSRFLRAVEALNKYCDDQRFTGIKVFEQDKMLVYALPTLSTSMTRHNVSALNQFIHETNGVFSSNDVIKLVEKLKTHCRRYLPSGTNAGNFIAAAAEHKIPFKIFSNRYLIFGYASGSTIFNSSITDQESAIGVSLAKSKYVTNKFLRLSGFPVAGQARIASAKDAIKFARENGYPLVLKPENEEQGRGIFANITNKQDLLDCYSKVLKDFDKILIETHIAGYHYRIDFMEEKLIKAVRRQAPMIVGDGYKSVQLLIDALNKDPERLDPASSKKMVVLDDDLYRCLAIQNIMIDDVLPKGRTIFLKSISNLSRGGEQVHVESEVHPENLALCKSVARAMRLQIAGIDILSKDISKPWYTNGAAICEVNAQPQLGKGRTEIYWSVLREFLRPPAEVTLNVSSKQSFGRSALYDTDLSQVNISLSVADVLSKGAPTQYINKLEIADDVSEADRRTLKQMLVSVMPEQIQ